MNRLLTRFMGEIIAAIDEGTDPAVADGALAPLGLPMTPIMLLQLVGPAVALHVTETLHEAYPDRFVVSDEPAADRRCRPSHPGVLDRDRRATAGSGDRRNSGSRARAASTAEQVRDRALAAMAQEARLMLDEKVVAAAADIDLALLTGAGWPFWLGGITPYLDRKGISEKVTGPRFNPPGVSTLPVTDSRRTGRPSRRDRDVSMLHVERVL